MARKPRAADIWPTARRPWGAFWRDHWRVASDTLAFVSLRFGATMLVWLAIGIAVALPAGLYLIDQNLARVAGSWHGTHGFSVYLELDADTEAATDLAQRLRAEQDIATVQLITPAAALAELADQLELHDTLAALDENPLPTTIRAGAKPNAPVMRLRHLANRMERLPGVDAVVVEKAWLERLAAIRALVVRLAWLATVLLGVGVMLVAAACVRLAIEVRLGELQVHALVGAGGRYMRRPFLYLGMVYGLGGGTVAAMLVATALAWLEPPMQRLAASYDAELIVTGFNDAFVIALLGSGIMLGVAGAAITSRQRLRGLDIA